MNRRFAISVLGGLLVSAALGEAQDVPNATPAPAQHLKTYHDGSIRDISAIGHRNVGCERGLGNWYTLEKQVAMGKQLVREVELTNRLVLDPVVTEYVNRLGQKLVRNSDARMAFTIKIIESDEINAFGLPGGFFYMNSGLLLAADNEAELAGVMAHEIAHVAACHAARAHTRGALVKLSRTPLIFVGSSIAFAAVNAVLPVAFMKFSRSFEADADYLGLQYLYHAGYDPQAFVSFFERNEAKEEKKPGFLARTLMTHPPTADRVKKIQQEIATLLPPKPEYILDNSDFEDVKARLAASENRHRLNNQQNERPTLRRRAQGPSDGQHTSNDVDERPILKRRNGPTPGA
jgi:predicted Zn-dependent protease